MGYLEELRECYNRDDGLFMDAQLDACTYPAYYRFWTNELFQRLTRLFVWNNTYKIEDGKLIGVDPKQLETRLILRGFTVIAKMKDTDKELTSFFGSMFGPTKYYNEWKKVNIHCPIYAGTRSIDQDAVIINNTSIRNPSYMYVHHYATLLAHAEVTLVDMMIDARDNGGVPIARTQKQFESIRAYQNKRFIGKYGVVTDIGGLGVDYAGSDRKTSQSILEVLEARNKLIRSFYSDIGIRAAFEKKSNVNSLEIDGNDSLLKFNISDALEQRKLACEKINTLFDVDWSVELPEEIDYEKIEEEEQQAMMNRMNNSSQLENEEKGEEDNDKTEEK